MEENENPGDPTDPVEPNRLPPMPVPASELNQTLRGVTSGDLVNFRLPLIDGLPPLQPRWTILIRILLVIPQFIVLFFVGIGVFFVAIAAWFTALFTGRVPEGMAAFFQSYVRWSARVGSYVELLSAEYPPFDGQPNPAYPVDVEFPPLTDLNRAAVFFRIIIAIPGYAMGTFLSTGLFALIFPFWICALVLGRLPDPVYRAVGTVTRFQVRLQAYMLLVTPEYPWGWKGDNVGVAGDGASSTNGTTRFDFVLVGAAQAWIWIWLVIGVIYEVFFRRR
jgi:Domain of unknown function (DUF4389)